MARTPRYHSPEYLEQAIKLVVEIGHPIDYVATKLNISMELLGHLVDRAVEKVDQSVHRLPVEKNADIPPTGEFVAKSELLAITRR